LLRDSHCAKNRHCWYLGENLVYLITLWIGDMKISASGVVVSSHPSFGNGIKFTRLPDESKDRLQQYLECMKRSGIARSETYGRTA